MDIEGKRVINPKREPKPEMIEENVKQTPRKRHANTDTNDQRSKLSIKKKKSSEKERVRNLQIKECLETIRYHVPYVEKSLSKIRTLRLASEYINHLQRILNGEMINCDLTGTRRPLLPDDFKHVVMKEMQITNSYKERADLEISSESNSTPQIGSPNFKEDKPLNPLNPLPSLPQLTSLNPPPSLNQLSNYQQYAQMKQQPTFPSIQFSDCKVFSPSFYQFV